MNNYFTELYVFIIYLFILNSKKNFFIKIEITKMSFLQQLLKDFKDV